MPKLSSALLAVSFIGLLALGVVRLVSVWPVASSWVGELERRVEAMRPARLTTTVVTDSTCSECSPVEPFIAALRRQNVEVVSQELLDVATPAGQQAALQRGATRVPVVLVRGELSRNAPLVSFLAQAGQVAGETFSYLPPPPYRQLAGGQTRGLFTTTYLTADSCPTCYDVTRNAAALANLGITVLSSKTTSAASREGQELVREYRIRYLPTIVLTGDLEAYPDFQEVWPQVGSREAGGVYVLRDGVKLMGTYYDRELKRTVAPPPAS